MNGCYCGKYALGIIDSIASCSLLGWSFKCHVVNYCLWGWCEYGKYLKKLQKKYFKNFEIGIFKN